MCVLGLARTVGPSKTGTSGSNRLETSKHDLVTDTMLANPLDLFEYREENEIGQTYANIRSCVARGDSWGKNGKKSSIHPGILGGDARVRSGDPEHM